MTTTKPARLSAERLEAIRNMELPKGRAVVAIADLLDELDALVAERDAAFEQGRAKERASVLERARKLNYGPTLRRFARDISRGYHEHDEWAAKEAP